MAGKSGKNGALYFIVGALAVVVVILGYVVISGGADEPDLSIDVDEQGIDVETG